MVTRRNLLKHDFKFPWLGTIAYEVFSQPVVQFQNALICESWLSPNDLVRIIRYLQRFVERKASLCISSIELRMQFIDAIAQHPDCTVAFSVQADRKGRCCQHGELNGLIKKWVSVVKSYFSHLAFLFLAEPSLIAPSTIICSSDESVRKGSIPTCHTSCQQGVQLLERLLEAVERHCRDRLLQRGDVLGEVAGGPEVAELR